MDGALVNPVPVSTARALGAHLVVAGNLQADIYGRGAVVPSHGSDETDETVISRWQEQRQNTRLGAARAAARITQTDLKPRPGYAPKTHTGAWQSTSRCPGR